jgi:hypothetical protein
MRKLGTPLILAFATSLPAQALVVGPGGFPDLDSAYAAAAAGDLILVRQDTSFTRLSSKGVRIVSDGSRYRLDALGGVLTAGVALIPAGQRFELRGFDIAPVGNAAGGAPALVFDQCPGVVQLIDCTVDGNLTLQTDTSPTMRIADCDAVFVYDSTLRGRDAFSGGVCTGAGTDGLEIAHSTVVLQNTFAYGGDLGDSSINGCPSAPAGAGLDATDSTVYFVHSQVSGGSTLSVPIDLHAANSTIYGTTPLYLAATGGVYVNYDSASPVQLVPANVVNATNKPSRVMAQVAATGASVSAQAHPSANVVLTAFGVGTPGFFGPLSPFAEPMLLDPSAPIAVFAAAGSSLSWSLSPTAMAALRGATFGVTCVDLLSNGELVLGSGAVLAF